MLKLTFLLSQCRDPLTGFVFCRGYTVFFGILGLSQDEITWYGLFSRISY